MKKIIESAVVLCFASALFGDVKSMDADADLEKFTEVCGRHAAAVRDQEAAVNRQFEMHRERLDQVDERLGRPLWGQSGETNAELNAEVAQLAQLGDGLPVGLDPRQEAAQREAARQQEEELMRLQQGVHRALMQEQSSGSGFVNFWNRIRTGISDFFGWVVDLFN
ncbi:MAG: hypothetical protein LBJ96_04785 [Holosporaceae bacterium]|nr:hypothetical protein [Holosporaceae bacterium]